MGTQAPPLEASAADKFLKTLVHRYHATSSGGNRSDADGSSLSTRAVLVDGQRFSVAFEGEEDETSDTSFAFWRKGQSVEVTMFQNLPPSKIEMR